MALFLKNKIN